MALIRYTTSRIREVFEAKTTHLSTSLTWLTKVLITTFRHDEIRVRGSANYSLIKQQESYFRRAFLRVISS